MFIIENEGNIRLATGLPPVHIAIIGMEKLVPTLHDAYKVAEVTWRYANYTVPGYVSLISSPSKTGDIEKVTTYGATTQGVACHLSGWRLTELAEPHAQPGHTA
jgi:L-lactate dehydrogenase complex protein LldG